MEPARHPSAIRSYRSRRPPRWQLEPYACNGGPVCPVAIARSACDGKPADYVLLVQVRGNRVIDIPRQALSIPKGWHQKLSTKQTGASDLRGV